MISEKQKRDLVAALVDFTDILERAYAKLGISGVSKADLLMTAYVMISRGNNEQPRPGGIDFNSIFFSEEDG